MTKISSILKIMLLATSSLGSLSGSALASEPSGHEMCDECKQLADDADTACDPANNAVFGDCDAARAALAECLEQNADKCPIPDSYWNELSEYFENNEMISE